MEVYLDNSATTRCFDEVAQLAAKVMAQDYGNPSSMHLKGVEGEKYLRHAREVIAKNGGIMHEDLPTPEKSLKQLEKESSLHKLVNK